MPLAVVLGATGSQGSGVINALLKDPKWTIRGISRSKDSSKALELSSKGVEMVAGDISHVDFLLSAFAGAEAIFAITAYWHLLDPRTIHEAGEKEYEQIQRIAIAASKTETLKHFVLSTLPSAEVVSKGKHLVPHFDYKVRGIEWIKVHLKELHEISTYVYVAFYSNNFVNEGFLRFVKARPGGYALILPASPEAVIPYAGEVSHNVGLAVKAALDSPEKTIGATISVATDSATYPEIVSLFEKVTGQTAIYSEVTDEAFEHLYGPLFGRELALGLRYHQYYPDDELPPLGSGPLMTLEDLGVKDQAIGLEEAMQGFGDDLL